MKNVLAKSKFYLTLSLVFILVIAYPIPQFPQAGLDGSWRIALTQLVPDDYQSVPVIFTYGIWGQLVRGAFIETNALSIIFFRSIIYIVYSCLILFYLRTSKSILFAWATFFVGIQGAFMSLFMPYFQTEFQLAILPILILCFEPFSKYLNKIILTLCIISGFIFFTKTSLYYYILPTTALYAASYTYLKSSGGFATKLSRFFIEILKCLAISFASIFIFSTIKLGQVFTQYSLLKDISSGYSSGMNTEGPAIEIVLACLLSISILISSFLIVRNKSLITPRRYLIARIIPSMYILVLSLKHAFVRHGHAPRFFIIQSFVLLAVFSGLTFYHSREDAWKIFKVQSIAILALLLSIFGSILIPIKYIMTNFDFYGGQFSRHVNTAKIFIGSVFGGKIHPSKDLKLPQNKRLSPEEITYIGSKTVDVIPGEISIPYFYDLNWLPRPTLQSYQGYTPRLDNLNANHLSKSGPDIILFHPDAIDHKHVSFFSPLEYQSLICNYRKSNLPSQKLNTSSITIFDRLGHSRCSPPVLISTGTSSFHDSKTFMFSSKPAYVALKLYLHPTLIGKLTELLLRAPKIELEISISSKDRLKEKIVEKYAFSYRTASNGLVLWPQLPGEINELSQYCNDQAICTFDQKNITFSVKTNAHWFFKDQFNYELHQSAIID